MSAETHPLPPVDEEKLNAFMGQMLGDLGGAVSSALVLVGDRLGLFKALKEGPAGSWDLARRTGTNERMVRE